MDEETKRCRVVHREPPWDVRSVNGRLAISPHDHESDLVIPEELEARIKRQIGDTEGVRALEAYPKH